MDRLATIIGYVIIVYIVLALLGLVVSPLAFVFGKLWWILLVLIVVWLIVKR